MSKNKPGYLQVAEFLSEKISKNVYPPGQKLPSVEELTEKFHVHKNTVKNAFKTLREKELVRNYPGVGIIVREDLKYPLKLAIVLPSGYCGLENFISGINGALQDYDASMRIVFYRNLKEQTEYLNTLKKNAFSGLIIRPDLSGDGYENLRKLQHDKFPVVLVENYYPGPGCYAVDAGTFDAAFIAVKHLKSIDKFPVAVICPDDKFGEFFVEAYKQAHSDLKEECRGSNIKRLGNTSPAGEAALQMMKAKNKPRSILCSSPRYVPSIYKQLKEAGIDLKHLQLVSFGDMPGFDFLDDRIISIKPDSKKLGRKAGNLLKQQLREDAGMPDSKIEKINIELKI